MHEKISGILRRRYPFLDIHYIDTNELIPDAANFIYPRYGCGPEPLKIEYFRNYLVIKGRATYYSDPDLFKVIQEGLEDHFLPKSHQADTNCVVEDGIEGS